MNEMTPKKSGACKAVMDLWAFIHGQIFKQPATTPPADTAAHNLLTIRVTLDVEPCCLEALFAVTQLGSLRAVLDSNQQACMGTICGQIQGQIPPVVQQSIRSAIGYQVERDLQREQRRLFHAAVVAPSIN